MDSKENKDTKILLVLIILGLAGLLIYKLFFEQKKIIKENIDTKSINIVIDQNDFFTVSSCVSKFLNYLSIRDTKSLLVLLSDKYKKDNSITEENIYSFINSLDGVYNFNPRKMYVQQKSKNVYKFYVYGLIEQESMDLEGEQSNYYLIVTLDKDNGTFSVEPYDGKIFK